MRLELSTTPGYSQGVPWRALPLLLLAAACSTPDRRPAPAHVEAEKDRALARIRSHERDLLQQKLNTALSPREGDSDPYRVCATDTAWVGLLRGSSELMLGRAATDPVERMAVSGRPVACAAEADSVWVLLEAPSALEAYRVTEGALQRERRVALPATLPRALARRGGLAYVADALSGLVSLVDVRAGTVQPASSESICRYPIALQLVGEQLLAACLWDHALVVRALQRSGALGAELDRAQHDGPLWGMTATTSAGAPLVAAGGVEDHPLQRFDGAFGYIDSFVYVYRLAQGRLARVLSVNLSEHALVTPKALLLETAGAATTLSVAGYGSAEWLQFDLANISNVPPPRAFPALPGISDWVRFQGRLLAADPLIDSFLELSHDAPRLLQPALPAANPRLLGELLAFTTLIGPEASSSAEHSRFTCETCHFEGGVDARVHHTGRGSVHVTTRPLQGLLRKAPHFSRALDPDLTSVSHNEFRVVSLGNHYDPWFGLDVTDYPWLSALGFRGRFSAELLRSALLDFLAEFEPPANPRVLQRDHFDAIEARGADVFEQVCERCHSARLVTNDGTTSVRRDAWERYIFSRTGPVLWARGEYERVGIEPYVHARGTRIPALRRIEHKYPYFTNGSARSLEAVLQNVRLTPTFQHAACAGCSSPLSDEQTHALLAFLRLL